MADRRTSVLFAALIAASALAVDPWGWDRYGPLRWALISTAGFMTVGVGVLGGPEDPRRIGRCERWGLGLLLGATLVSTALSRDLMHAVVGTPDRHFGLVTWLLCAGLFVVAARRRIDAAIVVRTAAISMVGIGVWTALELGDVGWFDSSFADGRAGGPFGQPAYLGAAAVLLTPVGAAPLLDRAVPRVDRRLAGVAAFAGLVALAGSGSRAAVAGALAAMIVLGAVAGVVSRRSVVSAGLAAVAVAAATPMGGRLADAVTSGDGLVSRSDEWAVGVRALRHAPANGLLGWGPETYRTVFGRFVDDDYVVAYGRDVITDRAHAGPLDVALSSGVIGVVGWGLLVGGVLVAARRGTSSGAMLAIAAAVVGYVVHQQFLFPLAELDPVFFGLLGMLASSTAKATPTSVAARPRRGHSVAGLVSLGLAAVAAFAGIADVAADRAIAETPADAASARALRPDSIRYHFISARTEARDDVPSMRRALDHLDDGLGLSGRDPALRLEQATVLTDLARTTSSVTDVRSARRRVDAHLVDDPRHPQLLMQAGILAALDGDLGEAASMLARSAALAPSAIEPRLNLALVLIELGRVADARSMLEAALDHAPGDPAIVGLLEEISDR